jgi:hypothetical protein
MKFKMALAALALSLVSASAQAQLRIVLDAGDPLSPTSVQTSSAPGRVEFSGTIFNDGPDTLVIIGDGVSAPGGVGTDVPNQDFAITNWETTLAPGDSFRGDYLFALDIPGGQTDFGGTYHVDTRLTTEDPNDPNFVPGFFAADYRVNIAGAAVPEPGTMALLVSGLIGGSLFMRRRRK